MGDDFAGARSRRQFLALLARAGAATVAAGSLPSWARDAFGASPSAAAPMIERNAYPEHWETTLETLGQAWLTPTQHFFVRSHFAAPQVDPDRWRLEVVGLVREPVSLTLAQLRAAPATSVTCVLECAGNGRALFPLANTSGTQWERGAVGNATWTGVRLAELLHRAGPAPEARHVWLEGADAAPLDSVPRFVRSIPLHKAAEDVILAHTMNGAPLPALHGAPVRAIVPGWFGMASTKWLTRIRVEAAPSDGQFMARGYRYVPPGGDPAAAPPVEGLRVKSLITQPLEGARLRPGEVRVRGFAWDGASGVRKVEVSADGGRNWREAELAVSSTPHAWRMFRTTLSLARGTVTLMARATDGAGQVQPLEAAINAGGYGNNSIHRVGLHVGA